MIDSLATSNFMACYVYANMDTFFLAGALLILGLCLRMAGCFRR